MDQVTVDAFADELTKISASFKFLGSAAQQYAKDLKGMGGASAARLVHSGARAAQKAGKVAPRAERTTLTGLKLGR